MAYSPPSNDATDFELVDAYAPPSNDTTDFELKTAIIRYASTHGNGSINTVRTVTQPRTATIDGRGSINTVRTVTQPRTATTYGSGGRIDIVLVSTTRDVNTTSYADKLWSTARTDRTSMELVDFDVTYDTDDLAWYTNWFPEDKMLPEQHDLALQMQTAPQADNPVAVIHVEYDADGNGDVDSRSEPIYVNESELVHDVTGVPSSEDGYYRLRIHDYGGYNDIYNINLGIIH